MNKWRKAAAASLLAFTMAATLMTGCGAKGTDAALVINNETVTLGTAEMMVRYQQAETATMLIGYGLAQPGSVWATQYTAATSTEEAQTFGMNLKDDAKNKFTQQICLEQHAEEYGVTISEEQKAAMAEAADQCFAANEAAFTKHNIVRDDVYRVLELQTIEALMRAPMVADTDRNVPDEDAAQSSITYARIPLSDTDLSTGEKTPATDEEKETYMVQLQELIDHVNDSGNPAEADITSYANAINQEKIATATYSYGEDYVLPDVVIEAANKLKDGEICQEVIDAGDYYYVVRMDHVFDKDATATKKKSIIATRESENYDAKLASWTDAATVEEKQPWIDLEVTDKDGFILKQDNGGSVVTQ